MLNYSGLSYTKGESKPDLTDLTMGEMVARTARLYPERPALVSRHQGLRYTWAEMDAEVSRLAKAFMAMGVKKGDRVGIWATNCAEWSLTQFATARMGAILVNVNTRYRSHELEYALKQSGCSLLILSRGFGSNDYVESLYSIAPELRHAVKGHGASPRLPELTKLIFVGDKTPEAMLSWADFRELSANISDEQLEARKKTLSCHDAVNLQYTSGTTGFPKGATLSHHNIVNNGQYVANTMKYTAEDSICIPVPLYHCFGMVLANMSSINSGAAMVLPAESFDAEATLKAVEEERCTSIYGVPTMFIAEFGLPDFENYDLKCLRTGIMAGSNCPIELMRRVVEDMNCHQLTTVYGLTESSPGMTQTRVDDSNELRVTTVGRAFPNTEVIISEPGTGRILPLGEVGEICCRGYLVMLGYWNDEKSTRETIEPEGWLHSGDLGTMDKNGYVRVTGRIKEMIIRGGENIYPREIEEYLLTCPKVADVQVIGIPDEKYGEEVMAWVRLKRGKQMTEDEVKEFCKGQIASYKIPRHVRFVDSYPITGSGKIQKFRMREMAVEEMQGGQPIHEALAQVC
jgi:fatty-acyl-CoA synthase